MVIYRHILVPLDGSELAEKALKPAYRIARAMADHAAATGGPAHVRLVLLRASAPLALVAADPMLYDEMIRMTNDEAQAYLNTVAATLPAEPIEVVAQVVNGSPADAIVHYTEENGVDLIVMSSHGRTGSSRWVYGSVAEKVMHHAPCATIIIRSQATVDLFENRKILVPLDGSELAERALEPALAIGRAVESDVLLVRVVPKSEPLPESMTPTGGRYESALDAAVQQEQEEAERYLQKVYSAHGDNRHLFFEVLPAAGDVADAIVSYADASHVDLIVMSSHGRSGIGRWLHGSVAEKVLRGAECATLIIRGPQS